MTEDFYDLLDVPPDAPQDEIKEAFRRQVRVYHPDLNDDDRARAQFTALKTAYDVLGDPVERQAYDRLGHTEYVAKRTSGLPSPDKWLSSEESNRRAPDGSTVDTETDSWGGSRKSSARSNTRRTGTARAAGTARTGTTTRNSRSTSARSNPLVRWWRSMNFGLPLLWITTIVYLIGLAQYSVANSYAYEGLWSAIAAAGLGIDELWAMLTATSYGLESGYAFVTATEVVTPPVDPTLWYAAIATFNLVVLGALAGVRHRYRSNAFGPVTTDETIVLAASIGASAILVGGPLLAGTLLLPLVYGVVIHRSHRFPGWSPSYAYLVAVTLPLGVLGAGWYGVSLVTTELIALVLVPVAGAVGLPLRFVVRRRFGI